MFDIIAQAETLPHRHLRAGDYIYRVGKPCDGNIFVVVEGTVIEVDDTETFRYGTEIDAGGIFGDIEVMSGCENRLQTFKVKSLSLTLAIMDKRAVQLLGGLYPEFFLKLLKSSIDNLHQAEQILLQDHPEGVALPEQESET
jgi:CRP-like cAMP-binding protein